MHWPHHLYCLSFVFPSLNAFLLQLCHLSSKLAYLMIYFFLLKLKIKMTFKLKKKSYLLVLRSLGRLHAAIFGHPRWKMAMSSVWATVVGTLPSTWCTEPARQVQGWPVSPSCKSTLIVSEFWDYLLPVWLLLPPTLTNQPTERTLMTFYSSALTLIHVGYDSACSFIVQSVHGKLGVVPKFVRSML